MNTLLLNRDTFQMPADGWYQIAPLGEFPHSAGGVVQIVDREACAAMANRFTVEAKTANFAGLLVDFDHFSLDGEKRSEAAGWITDLQNRDAGLFAKIRWSDVGEEAVKGGRYRFLSPVWARSDCVDLGNGRLRPVRLLNAAVTNDPNLKGMVPLSNRTTGPQDHGTTGPAPGTGKPREPAAGGQRGVTRFKWVLGESPEGRHCPSCAAMAGQVHSTEVWNAAGVGPGGTGLYCQGNCHCSLVETDEPETGKIEDAPVRREKGNLKLETGDSGKAPPASRREVLGNAWSDAARSASLAVRRAKAAARKSAGGSSRSTSGAAAVVRRAGRVKEADLVDFPDETRAAFEETIARGVLSRLKDGQLEPIDDAKVDAAVREALSQAYRRQAERVQGLNESGGTREGQVAGSARVAAGGTTRARDRTAVPGRPAPAQPVSRPEPGRMYPGGTPDFDEKTGKRIWPVPPTQLPPDPGGPHILPVPYPYSLAKARVTTDKQRVRSARSTGSRQAGRPGR